MSANLRSAAAARGGGGDGAAAETGGEATAPKMQSFVFVDLESTGLFGENMDRATAELAFRERSPGDVLRENVRLRGARPPRITELAFVAVHRSVLDEAIQWNDMAPPRALATHTRQIDPQFESAQWAAFHLSKASEISGLNKHHLQRANSLSVEWPGVLYFLERLPQPVCLLAHNAVGFDLRLLAAECERLRLPPLPPTMLFVDTYWAIRQLDRQYARDVNRELAQRMPNQVAMQAMRRLNELSEACTQPPSTSPSVVAPTDTNAITPPSNERGASVSARRRLFGGAAAAGDELPNVTAAAAAAVAPMDCLDRYGWTPAKRRRISDDSFRRSGDGCWEVAETAPTTGRYSLTRLHEELVGRSPSGAHTADADAKNLLRVCLHYGLDFIHHCDNSALPLRFHD